MKHSLIVSIVCLLGVSNAWAIVVGDTSACPDRTCDALGYTWSITEADNKCNNVYFTCPASRACIKCDDIATVGDIKFSSATSNHDGWLLANGNSGVTLSGSNYPDLYNLLGSSTVPNLTGRFLRGIGTSNLSSNYVGVSGNQDQTMKTHSHGFSYKYYANSSNKFYMEWGDSKYDPCRGVSYSPPETDEVTGSQYVCPERIGLNAFIYAGRKK